MAAIRMASTTRPQAEAAQQPVASDPSPGTQAGSSKRLAVALALFVLWTAFLAWMAIGG